MISEALLHKLPKPTTASATPAAPNLDLDTALTNANVLLKARAKDMRTLYEFPVVIPTELSKLVASTDATERDSIQSKVAQHGWDRRRLIQVIQSQERELVNARAAVEAGRAATAPAIIGEYNERYRVALEGFQRLLAEGSALSQCLRSADVSTPLPVKLERGWTPDDPSRRGVNWSPDGYGVDRPNRLLPDTGTATAPPLPAGIARIGATLDALDQALSFNAAIASHLKRVTELSYKRTADSSTNFDGRSTFVVRQSFNDPLLGTAYAPGTFVSSDQIAVPLLSLQHKAKHVEMVS